MGGTIENELSKETMIKIEAWIHAITLWTSMHRPPGERFHILRKRFWQAATSFTAARYNYRVALASRSDPLGYEMCKIIYEVVRSVKSDTYRLTSRKVPRLDRIGMPGRTIQSNGSIRVV